MTNDLRKAIEAMVDAVSKMPMDEFVFGPIPKWVGLPAEFSLWDEIMNINPSWTPAQFDRMWDGLSHKGKVNFVKKLITPKE